jgi:hypothetical protein
MSDNDDELLRKAREYVEKHKNNKGDKRKSNKHAHQHRAEEVEQEKRRGRRRKRRDEDDEDDDDDRSNDNDEERRTKIKRKKSSSSKRSRNEDRHRDKDRKRYRRHRRRDDSLSSSSEMSDSRNRGRDDDRGSDRIRSADRKHSKRRDSSKKSKDKDRRKDHRSSDQKSSKHRSSRDDYDDRKQRQHKDERKKKHKKKDKEQHGYGDKDKSSGKTSNQKLSKQDIAKIQKLTPLLGEITQKIPTKLINTDDYFTYHNHLRLFLYHSTASYFEDLTSSETHKLFETFCDKYNTGALEEVYYDTKLELPEEAMEACKRTKHQWKFNTNVTERKSLDLIKSGVKRQTDYHRNESKDMGSAQKGAMFCAPINSKIHDSSNSNIRNKRPMIPERKTEPVITETINNQDKDKQEAMLKMLGLNGIKAGQKIKIAPRK